MPTSVVNPNGKTLESNLSRTPAKIQKPWCTPPHFTPHNHDVHFHFRIMRHKIRQGNYSLPALLALNLHDRIAIMIAFGIALRTWWCRHQYRPSLKALGQLLKMYCKVALLPHNRQLGILFLPYVRRFAGLSRS